MITLTLKPIQHQIILDSLKITEKQMRENDLCMAAKMVKDTINEISLDTLEDKSKCINEKD